jgi:RNA polymerase sigma-70 factor (ECF subfamily)
MSAPREFDDDVVRAAKGGDADAWRVLYDAVAGRLVGWLRSQQPADAAIDAEDIASEAWLTAARRVGEFTGTADDFGGWLFVVAKNVMVNANRRSARRATLPTDIDPRLLVRASDVDDTAVVDAADWTRQVLSQLPEREREVVAAIDVAGLDVAATSRLLAMSRTAVRSAHYRGRRKLAVVLADEGRRRRPRSAEEARWPRVVARLSALDGD